jgi:hypothetical protein
VAEGGRAGGEHLDGRPGGVGRVEAAAAARPTARPAPGCRAEVVAKVGAAVEVGRRHMGMGTGGLR